MNIHRVPYLKQQRCTEKEHLRTFQFQTFSRHRDFKCIPTVHEPISVLCFLMQKASNEQSSKYYVFNTKYEKHTKIQVNSAMRHQMALNLQAKSFNSFNNLISDWFVICDNSVWLMRIQSLLEILHQSIFLKDFRICALSIFFPLRCEADVEKNIVVCFSEKSLGSNHPSKYGRR